MVLCVAQYQRSLSYYQGGTRRADGVLLLLLYTHTREHTCTHTHTHTATGRAVLVELTVFNPPLNRFTLVQAIVELPATGGMVPHANMFDPPSKSMWCGAADLRGTDGAYGAMGMPCTDPVYGAMAVRGTDGNFFFFFFFVGTGTAGQLS
eukprot:3941374-Rhodomonas_salina.2